MIISTLRASLQTFYSRPVYIFNADLQIEETVFVDVIALALSDLAKTRVVGLDLTVVSQ